jgi:hypothetical protein
MTGHLLSSQFYAGGRECPRYETEIIAVFPLRRLPSLGSLSIKDLIAAAERPWCEQEGLVFDD